MKKTTNELTNEITTEQDNILSSLLQLDWVHTQTLTCEKKGVRFV